MTHLVDYLDVEERGKRLVENVKRFVKRRLNNLIRFITGKSNKAVRNNLIGLLVIYFLLKTITITKFIFNISPKLGSFYLGGIFYFFCIFMAIFAAMSLNFIYEKIRENSVKNKEKYNRSIYIWLGEDFISEKFISNLFSKKAHVNYDDITNLKNIKKTLELKLGDDSTIYLLLKNHFEFKQKNNSTKKLMIIIFAILGTLVTASITTFIQKVINIEKFMSNINFELLLNFFSNMEYYMLFFYLGVGFTVYVIILTTYSNITERSRRNEYIISILDILIKSKIN